MDFALTTEQRDLQRGLRQFLAQRWPDDALRASFDGPTAYETEVWSRLAGDLGAAGLVIPEEYGGIGLSWVEGVLAAEELGRVLSGGPWFATVALAANALLASGDGQAMKDYLPEIAAGGLTATLAHEDLRGRDGSRPAVRAHETTAGWCLDGTKDHVVDGATADLVLVTAETDGGVALFAVESSDAVVRTAQVAMDPTRRLARIELADAPARLVGTPGAARLAHVLDIAALVAAAEAVGGASACIDLTVEHVKGREQFGKAIGSFQAVKHRLADMQVRLDTSRAAVRYVAAAVDDEPDQLPTLVSVAKPYATTAYFRTAADTIQLHGGIGFTWEHAAHLHFKRAKALELALGTPVQHRARIAAELFGEPAR
jgi:alkylation response protein AidB-like acyl-CoA dehydrogenase